MKGANRGTRVGLKYVMNNLTYMAGGVLIDAITGEFVKYPVDIPEDADPDALILFPFDAWQASDLVDPFDLIFDF